MLKKKSVLMVTTGGVIYIISEVRLMQISPKSYSGISGSIPLSFLENRIPTSIKLSLKRVLTREDRFLPSPSQIKIRLSEDCH